ncbi:hypothetical protein [Sulfurovum sp.]|uniref:hypothetical protein n=1 Tax=Sulfurovum sp. TaxID=1969726 RepID=UPI002867D2BC|nr:hypothetical protein [Sulfurovum sp.]
MLETILSSHSLLVKVLLGFLVGGLLIPMLTAKNPLGFKKASLIYTFTFQGITTMIAFVGVVAMFMADLPMTVSIYIMVALWAVMMYIEIKKYKVIKMANTDNPETHSLLKGAFYKISMVHILLVVIMIVLMVLNAKGVISI